MYDFEWHERHAAKTRCSAEQVLTIVRSVLPFESALDVGCGTGLWLDVAKRLGCAEIRGIDGPWTDATSLLISGEDFTVADLAKPFALVYVVRCRRELRCRDILKLH